MSKHIITSAVLFLFLWSGTQAQNFEGKILIAIVASQVDGDGLAGYNKPGVQAGIVVNKKIRKNWHISSGFVYTSKGSWQNTSATPPGYSPKKINLHYAEIPFQAKYMITAKWTIAAGIAAGYLFYARVTDDFGLYTPEFTNDYFNFDFSTHIGPEYRVNDKMSVFAHLNRSMIFIREYPFHINNYLTSGLLYHIR